ncbi:TlpA disulfide reductase family protein [Ectopseudomonas mendocina]|uniref:TlpA disulfide reductase family protein n=1 Tax=Ectopseudomonas mendocina TaxID=300 RepID=A0ABZ2RHQ0_ECTME
MMTLNVGPFPVPVSHLIIGLSFGLSLLVGWRLGRRDQLNPENYIFFLLFVGLITARLAFVAVYFEHFADQPWRVIDIRDGGFIAWVGVLAALLLAAVLAWRKVRLRRSLGAAVGAGLLSWALMSYVLFALTGATRLPEFGLRDVQGQAVSLQDYVGKPLVINLWATWCPPCRREMPVLAEAQQAMPGVTFLFVNQGESVQEVEKYLATEALQLNNVLLDSGARLGQHIGSTALPTTLFYDRNGYQVGSHLGELSRASLAQALKQLDSKD